MKDIHQLLREMARKETALKQSTFLAPRPIGAKVQTRVDGLVYTFSCQQKDFEGWGIFRPVDEKQAELLEEGDFMQIDAYLHLFPAFRLHLAYPMMGRSWMAFPTNIADMKQRVGWAGPVVVHLADHASAMEAIIARFDGGSFWFESMDRKADPWMSEELRTHLSNLQLPEEVKIKGLTPEQKACYELALFQKLEQVIAEEERKLQEEALRQEREARRWIREQGREERRQIAIANLQKAYWNGEYAGKRSSQKEQNLGEARLEKALTFAGARLRTYRDRGEYWVVDWTSPSGEQHTSAVAKKDLTVISSGICLDGEDAKFDLTSLVKIMEQRPDWA